MSISRSSLAIACAVLCGGLAAHASKPPPKPTPKKEEVPKVPPTQPAPHGMLRFFMGQPKSRFDDGGKQVVCTPVATDSGEHCWACTKDTSSSSNTDMNAGVAPGYSLVPLSIGGFQQYRPVRTGKLPSDVSFHKIDDKDFQKAKTDETAHLKDLQSVEKQYYTMQIKMFENQLKACGKSGSCKDTLFKRFGGDKGPPPPPPSAGGHDVPVQ